MSFRLTCFKRAILLLVLLTFIWCVFFEISISDNPVRYQKPEFVYKEDNVVQTASLRTDKPAPILILRYTKYFSSIYPNMIVNPVDCGHMNGRTRLPMFNAPCEITFNRTRMNGSDALVFHFSNLEDEELPFEKRNLLQPWVYHSSEPAHFYKLMLKKYANVFNWTMTYRHDSDVLDPYGLILPRANASAAVTTPCVNISQKTGLVAWIVSRQTNPSRRKYFVRELQKHISVDIYGALGEKCPILDCYSFVASRYKFYLSFENSLCVDYITEKFFKALSVGILPVVYGGGDYKAVAPPNSFIDARAFDSPKSLADYLKYLDKNETEYRKYFEWKPNYEVFCTERRSVCTWCNLCQRIHEHRNEYPRKVKWYKDLWKWWYFYKSSTTNQTLPVCMVPPTNLTKFSDNANIFEKGVDALGFMY